MKKNTIAIKHPTANAYVTGDIELSPMVSQKSVMITVSQKLNQVPPVTYFLSKKNAIHLLSEIIAIFAEMEEEIKNGKPN